MKKKTNNDIYNLFGTEELNKFFDEDELNNNGNAAFNDLNLEIVEEKDSTNISLVYLESIFKEETAKGFLETFSLILEQLSNLNTNSLFMISDLKWINKEEETKIVNDFNFVDFPHTKMIYELFEEQVELNPNNNYKIVAGTSLFLLPLHLYYDR
jgi:hypothetical protein